MNTSCRALRGAEEVRMERRRLGRTGHESSVAVLGAAAFWRCTAAEAEAAFELALRVGVNHIDIAPAYGHAEVVAGPLVAAARDQLFVAAKSDRSNGDGVRAHLERTLERLGCDRLDLYQVHGVTSLAVLDERAAAAEAVLRARDEGLTRFVGITGHDLGTPLAQLEAVRRYDLDTVMFPIYPRVWADPVYRAAAEELLAECATRDVGVMAIKAVARRPWGDTSPTANTWYEPWTTDDEIERGVRFALSTPGVHAFCTTGDLGLLPRVLEAADRYRALDRSEREGAMAAMAEEEILFPLVEKARRND
jgi:aryl-alcohol dehydrogenase-like predicted oxidoreductase